jgi:hypothetical protein
MLGRVTPIQQLIHSRATAKSMGNDHTHAAKNMEIMQHRLSRAHTFTRRHGALSASRRHAAAPYHASMPLRAEAAGSTTRRRHWRKAGQVDVPPEVTAAGRAATRCGGTLHVSADERATTALLSFALRGGPFCHFTRTGDPFWQNFA